MPALMILLDRATGRGWSRRGSVAGQAVAAAGGVTPGDDQYDADHLDPRQALAEQDERDDGAIRRELAARGPP